MRYPGIGILIAILGLTSAAMGQAIMPASGGFEAPRLDLSVGYNHIGANAPPGSSCPCFGTNGAVVSADLHVVTWLSFAGEVSGSHASHISTLGQNLTLTTFLAGPRASRSMRAFTPFAEALFGAARGTGSYFPTAGGSKSSASSFAFSTGGGIDFRLTRRMALRAVEAQYLHSSLPNGVENTQNEFQLSTGIVFRLGQRDEYVSRVEPLPPPPPVRRSEISFSCGATETQIAAGDTVQIVGESMTLPDQLDVSYKWTTNAGAVDGDGRMISINTAGLNPGTYRVEGRATLVSDPSVGANCQATFHVKHDKQTVVAAAAPLVENLAPPSAHEDDFLSHMHDIFFEYNKSRIRGEARNAVADDAAYLIAHPEVKITIAGYADERGTADYNISLGLKRANETRDALVSLGVADSRIQVLSYGKEKSFCSDNTDACFQRNRRAQFLRGN